MTTTKPLPPLTSTSCDEREELQQLRREIRVSRREGDLAKSGTLEERFQKLE